MTVNINFNKDEFLTHFNGYRNKIKFDEKFFKDIATIILHDTKNRIKSEKKDPDGRAWAPWASSTSKARHAKGTAALGLLFDTGKLYNSFQYKITKTGFDLGTNVPYAAYLHMGTKNMPARRILGISKKVVEDVTKLLEQKFGATR